MWAGDERQEKRGDTIEKSESRAKWRQVHFGSQVKLRLDTRGQGKEKAINRKEPCAARRQARAERSRKTFNWHYNAERLQSHMYLGVSQVEFFSMHF